MLTWKIRNFSLLLSFFRNSSHLPFGYWLMQAHSKLSLATALLFAEPRQPNPYWGLSVSILSTIPVMLQILPKLLRNNYSFLCIPIVLVGLGKYNEQERKNPNVQSLTFGNTSFLSMFPFSLVCVTMGFDLGLALCYITFCFKVIDMLAFSLF